MKKIILLAIVTYFLIAPITFHPDTKLTLRYPALENGLVWDIYGYINNHELDIPDFHYPPAHYWWLKIHYPISKFIGGQGFDNWLASGSAQASFDVNIFRYNLAAKFPLLLLGLICGFLIYLIVKKETNNENEGKRAALFWFFNPITLYSLVIMGQNDIVAITLFLLGIIFYKNWCLTALMWGLASGVKSYPIIWAVMFLLVMEKNIIKLILKTVSVVLVYGLILLPWLGKDYFTQAVLNSGLSQRMFIASIPIGFGKQISIVPLLLIIIGLNIWKKKSSYKMANACLSIFQSCLVILGFSHFNPQWMLWTIPFLSIWIFTSEITKREILTLLLIFGCWTVLTLGFDDKFLSWGLLSPLSPSLINFPSLVEFAKNRGLEVSGIFNLSQSVLAGISLWYMTIKLKNKKWKNKSIKIKNWLILIPWLLVTLMILWLTNIKTINKEYAQTSGKEVYLAELIDKKWSYQIKNNLKYFEVSLNNPGLNSQDRGVLVVTDDQGNIFEKDFSGFNAGVNSWLRVDVPSNMSKSEYLTMEVKNIIVNDGLLKMQVDGDDKWAINFYNVVELSVVEVINKLLLFWWWWLILAGISFIYIKVRKD